MITHRVLAPLTLLIIFTHSSLRAEEEQPAKPVPQALALKLGPDKLTDAQLDDLLAYLESLQGATPAPAAGNR